VRAEGGGDGGGDGGAEKRGASSASSLASSVCDVRAYEDGRRSSQTFASEAGEFVLTRGDHAGGGGADGDGSATERRTLPSPDVSVTTAIEESRVGDTMRGAAAAECARGRLSRVEKGAVMRRGSDTLR